MWHPIFDGISVAQRYRLTGRWTIWYKSEFTPRLQEERSRLQPGELLREQKGQPAELAAFDASCPFCRKRRRMLRRFFLSQTGRAGPCTGVEPMTVDSSWVEDEFEEIFREHFGRLLRVTRRVLRSDAEAEEVCAEVFLRLSATDRRWSRTDRRGALPPWNTSSDRHPAQESALK